MSTATETVRVGLVGSGFVTSIHHEALRSLPGVQVVAVASPSAGHAERFAVERGIPRHFTEFRSLLDLREIDMVVLGLPNDRHCEVTCLAAQAGKHVVVEKPMAMNLAECDRMIAACERAGVMLAYAEELCFAPKYVRLKQLIEEGAFGKVHLVKQSEKHDGPHTDWFFDTRRSGGGVTFDMGCHAIEFFRWILGAGTPGGKARIESVYAQMGTYVHGAKTIGDDEAVLLLTFEGGAVGLAEESWTKPGGMDDRAEVFGTDGQAYADVLYGNSLRAFSAPMGTATPSRKQGLPPVGRFRSTRRSGITAFLRKWSTSSHASAVECSRVRTATTGARSSKLFSPSTSQPLWAVESSCRSQATLSARSTTGGRPAGIDDAHSR